MIITRKGYLEGQNIMVSGFQRRGRTTPFFIQLVTVILMIWLLLLGITMALTLRYAMNTMQEKIDNGLSAAAESLSSNGSVRQAFENGACSG